MKTQLWTAALALLVAPTAEAVDFWFALDTSSDPPPADTVHYTTVEAACKAAYAADKAYFEGRQSQELLAYVPPTFEQGSANAPLYNCNQNWQYTIDGSSWTLDYLPHLITRQGDACPSGLVYDLVAGQCESIDDFNRRRQMGDPNDNPNNDPNDCQGNPVNAAIGNKFELETDFEDQDGELAFHRYYNGLDGGWRHSYGATLAVGSTSASLTFDDGRVSLFVINGSVVTGEPSERGSLASKNGVWTYSGPDNRTMTFDGQGQLSSVRLPDGRTSTIKHGYDADFNPQVTVTGSQGRSLVWTEDTSGNLATLTVSGLSVTYAYGVPGQLLSATRVQSGKTTSRSYLYEVSGNPALLTGITDERGVRFATWAYDDQGRAVSSEHAGGAEKVTIAYNADGTTTVTNALGHVVTYTYALAAGTMRMSKVVGSPVPGCPISDSSFTYDARGQIATQADALGHITAFAYDTQGRITTKTEAKGTAQERVTTTAWDGTSFRPKTVTTPDRVTTYTYDTKGRLTGTKVSVRVH
ncbi:DUF6531 domain-containing protein [Xanthomonas sp. NCPPB 2632]|uniref:DUF6531 domain-containing protein n=1 Tax=Xanthomonas sp. NCPPB 2632 TaxID=3240912 RepID=UPI003515C0E8